MATPIDLTQPYGTSARGFRDKNIFADQARLLGPESRVVIDVGAHHGDELPTYLSMFPDAIVYAIEPTPASVEILRSAYGSHPRVRIHSAALAEADGTATLHAYEISVRNALTPYDPDPMLGRAPDTPSDLVSVATWTLDRFCDEHGIDGIDLLKIDTQGAEGRVLSGAASLLARRRVRLISLEALFVPLFERQAHADELVATLRQAGYHLYDWYNFSHNDRGQLLFGDAIFLPEYPRQRIESPVPVLPDAAAESSRVSVEQSSLLDQRVEELKERITRLTAKTDRLRQRLAERGEKIERLKEARRKKR
jgi:FkbM family methyltransferase